VGEGVEWNFVCLFMLFVVAYVMEVFSFRKSGSQPLPVNPSKTAAKKEKKEKDPKVAAAM
jgi:Na+-transporting methylmalonyl-CoA/oxaloacetate decarboxylase gamma subunit